jgi:hypothetical protein
MVIGLTPSQHESVRLRSQLRLEPLQYCSGCTELSHYSANARNDEV